MKVTIELTEEEIRVIKIPDHDWGLDDNPSSCCHCELCKACDNILRKVRNGVTV